MSKQKFYRVVILLVLLSICPLFAQTWCLPIRVSPYVTDRYIVLGQGLTADLSGTSWCGWVADTDNPPAFNIYINHYTDTIWSNPDTIFPFFAFWNCDLATDANGNVWVVAEDDGISACFYDGSSWSNLMAVPSVSCCHYPVAIGDNLGNLWVCWAGGAPGDGHHIWGNAYIDGQWGSPVLISYPSSAEEITYSMTTDIQGNVWVGWYRFACPDRGICVSFNDGSGWSDTMMVVGYPHSYFTLGPALTVDTSGMIWAGWLGCDSIENWKVYASYFEDSVWSGPMLVSESAAWGDYSVAITSDDRGMVWLAWMNSDENICYSYWNGNEWSDPAPIDNHPARDYNLKMAFDGERIWVTWIRRVEISGQDTFSVYASYTYGVGVEEKPVANPPPSVSGLSQSYPNPFSSNTTISYQLPSDCHVCVRIYNIAGELVQTLRSKNQKPGHYTVCWNGKDENGKQLPSGVYFVRLKTPNNSITKKIIKLK
ncbi:T9SS type A sorting domain-containing protein [candidate division WOR-3 bacterium]|nr:T9SS type A sorting domain-containing protein [candidate division WOR-3 bacterium]